MARARAWAALRAAVDSHKHLPSKTGPRGEGVYHQIAISLKSAAYRRVSYMLLLERCDCDLGSLIYPKAGSEEEGQLSAPLMMKIATEMADGLAYLHSRGIKHLDMKPG